VLPKRAHLDTGEVTASIPVSPTSGEATADSDLDLLVDVDRGHGCLDMAGFALGVEDRLGVFTQVATPRGLKLRIRDRVLREAVVL